jgi:hypothetical protein
LMAVTWASAMYEPEGSFTAPLILPPTCPQRAAGKKASANKTNLVEYMPNV